MPSPFLPPPSAQQPTVDHELFRLGHRNLRVHVAGQAGLSLLVAAGAWQAAPHQHAVVWLAGMQLFALVLLAAWWVFAGAARAPQPPDDATLRRWQRTNFALVSVAGVAWGNLGWLFAPQAQVNNLMVMTSFAGALAYSAASNVYDLRAFYASVGIATALLLWHIPPVFGDQAGVVMGMCLLYLSLLVLVARSAHQTLLTSITLRLDNQQLALTNAAHAARAEKANRDKSEFLAAASHDLRQPVHALLLLIEAYRQRHPAAAQDPLIRQIAAAGQSVGTLFNALMELSRLESGTERVTLEPVRLADSLHSALQRALPEADRKGLRLRLRIAPGVATTRLHTDRLLLERVLGNLLSNAVRYTPRGGVLLALRPAHSGGKGDGGLWLEVWDSGVGIGPEDQTRIFDPYVQIGNRERDRTKGLGLGLAIVHSATGLLGLPLTLQSRPGHGSCFRLHLPATLLLPPAPATPPEPAAPGPEAPPPGLAGRRVLLIDDDPMVLQAMQALLGSWQADLRCSSDAHALQACEAGWTPECIICDFRLPGPLNGLQLLDQLQDHFPHAVGILQTGELAHTVQAAAEEAGYLVLFKPVPPQLLGQTLGAVLDDRTPPETPCTSSSSTTTR